jgi:CRP-like cAMP-binding protein
MEDDFDFTQSGAAKPAAPKANAAAATPPAPTQRSKFYDPAIARKLFETYGTKQSCVGGDVIFAENEKAIKGGLFSKGTLNRMYFIARGEVSLTAGGKALDAIRTGEIFGEMSVISDAPRSATATAKITSDLFTLDANQFQAAIQQMPAFALMLMSVMFDRLRLVAARLATRKTAPGRFDREAAVFDHATLNQLQKQIDHPSVLRYPAEKLVMQAGEPGAYMYVVLSGRIAISIKGAVVETIGVGGTFGEMALVDQSPRTADAGAVEESELLAINRADMLALVQKNPAFGVALLRSVAERLRHMNSLLA